jgi:phage regulator Rha-like protein
MEKMQVDLLRVERSIRMIRGDKVILDEDLAELYGVETKNLIKAVKRNLDRFPADFMFHLTNQEFANLRFQSGTSSQWGGRRTPPYAFSEQGVAMLSSVLNSPRAVQVNIEIMRTFVRLRKMLASHAELAESLEALEQKYDAQFRIVFDAIRQLMQPQVKERKEIGFKVKEGALAYLQEGVEGQA